MLHAVVEHRWSFVHLAANTVTDVIGQDAVAVANFLAFKFNVALDSVANLVEILSLGEASNTCPEGAFGDLRELFTLCHNLRTAGVWNNNSDGGVAIPLFVLRTSVDGDNISGFEDASTGNAVNDFVVHRCTHGVTVTGNQHEVGFAATVANSLLSCSINLESGHTRTNEGSCCIKSCSCNQTGFHHQPQLSWGLIDVGAETHQTQA